MKGMGGKRTPRPIPIAAAKEKFTYDPETGHFFDKRTGRQAASKKGARLTLCINGQSYYAHRVAWAMVYGKDPELVIDHINQNQHDHRIANLRDVSQSENIKNVAPERRNNGGWSRLPQYARRP